MAHKGRIGGAWRRIRQEAGWCILLLADFLIRVLPEKVSFFIVLVFSNCVYLSMRKRYTVAFRNLRFVFGGEKSEAEIKRMLKSVVNELAKNYWELIALYRNRARGIRDAVRIEGKENLAGALEQGKGVIAVSAHLGNFAIVCGRLTAEGYKYSAVAQQANDMRVTRYFSDIWRKQGMDIIPSSSVGAARSSLKALRENRVLGLYVDQNRAHDGIFVDFFGRPAATTPGPALLAARTGAPIVPLFITRQPDGSHTITIHPPLGMQATGNDREDILANTRKITGVVEEQIRKYPAQWWWFHNRWKTRPEGEKKKT